MKLISQLINSVSRILQKFLKHFNETVILMIFVLTAAGILPVILALILNGSKSVIVAFGLSLQHCYKRPDAIK